MIFGSRAKGNYKNGSDVDIAVKGRQVTNQIADSISGILNEDSFVPYNFDVLSYQHVTNPSLKEHVDRVGIAFYAKGYLNT